MKIKNLILAAALCGAFTLTATAETVTNAAATAGVQLTADQVAKLDNSINQIVPLIPAKYQGAVASVLGLLAVLGICGRILIGWRAGGFWGVLSGLFSGTNTPPAPITNDSIPPSAMPAPAKGASALRPIAFAGFIGVMALLACLVMTGCAANKANLTTPPPGHVVSAIGAVKQVGIGANPTTETATLGYQAAMVDVLTVPVQVVTTTNKDSSISQEYICPDVVKSYEINGNTTGIITGKAGSTFTLAVGKNAVRTLLGGQHLPINGGTNIVSNTSTNL